MHASIPFIVTGFTKKNPKCSMTDMFPYQDLGQARKSHQNISMKITREVLTSYSQMMEQYALFVPSSFPYLICNQSVSASFGGLFCFLLLFLSYVR